MSATVGLMVRFTDTTSLLAFLLNSKELRWFRAGWWGRRAGGSCPIKSWIFLALRFSNSSWCMSPCTVAVVHYDHKYASPRCSAV